MRRHRRHPGAKKIRSTHCAGRCARARNGTSGMNGYFYVLTIIDLFVLSFMCGLTLLSESLNKKQKRGFCVAFVFIAAISLLEVVTLVVDGKPPEYRGLNIAANYLGFGLSPAVPLCFVYVLDKKSAVRRKLRAASCCEAVYLLFLALSIPFGAVFSVSAENVYARGPWFFVYVILYAASILYLAVSTVLTASRFQNRSKALVYPLVFFLLAETTIQVVLPDLHVTWLCVTLLSVLYFIYCSEMWNQLDALTGLLNQNSYLNRTMELHGKSGVLVVFDVDDFKQVNDRYGHVQGDACLAEIADCIRRAYASCGYCYRIGGDEFCVLLKNAEQEAACAQEFVRLMEVRRETVGFLPGVSFGAAPFSGEDIAAAKECADHRMYHFKKEQKERARAERSTQP